MHTPFRRLVTSLVGATLVIGTALVGAVAPMTAEASTKSASSVARAGWQPNGNVNAIALTKDRIYIGGDFTALTNSKTGQVIRMHHLAAIGRKHGVLMRSWKGSTNDVVRDLAIFDGALAVAGNFTKVNGKDHQHVALIGLKYGIVQSGFNASVDGNVRALIATKDRLYMGGNFQNVNGQAHSRLAKVTTTGAPISGWPVGSTNNIVYTMRLSPSGRYVIVGGSFTVLNGANRNYLGMVSRASGQTLSWAPTATCTDHCVVLGLSVGTGTVVAGIAGPGGRAVAYKTTSNSALWRVYTDGDVQAVSIYLNQVYIGGHFGHVSKVRRPMLAMVSRTTGHLSSSFAPAASGNFFPGVNNVKARSDEIRVGGGFTSLGGRSRYAEFPMS